jgi:hypothetical protein
MYPKYRIGFSRSEQRLLEPTLPGLIDEEVAKELQVSLPANIEASTVERARSNLHPRASAGTTADIDETDPSKLIRLRTESRT